MDIDVHMVSAYLLGALAPGFCLIGLGLLGGGVAFYRREKFRKPMITMDFAASVQDRKRTRVFLLFLWCFVCGVAWIINLLSTFDMLPVGAMIVMNVMWLGFFWVFFFPFAYTPYDKSQSWSAVFSYDKVKDLALNQAKIFWSGVAAILAAVLLCGLMTAGICICDYPLAVTTTFSRSVGSSSCPDGKPCLVYLTLGQNVSSSMFVNFQISGPDPPCFISYDTVSLKNHSRTEYAFQTTPNRQHSNNKNIGRHIYFSLLKDLSPNTRYYFRCGCGDMESDEYSFVTGPADDTPFTFMDGGDTGVEDTTAQFLQYASKYDPLFGVLGGDIGYTQGFFTCYERWDHLIRMWHNNLRTTHGDLVPMVMVLGNHEAGGYKVSRSGLPYFLDFFPQQDEAEQPDFLEDPAMRSTYHYHLIGNSSMIVVLDSGISASVDGDQLQWLQQVMQIPRSNKMAMYHVGMYPTKRSYSDHLPVQMRANWQPLFDQHDVRMVFEHHDHRYKRSKPIKNDKVDDDGIVYMGDGCLGITPRKGRNDDWYTEKAASIMNVQIGIVSAFNDTVVVLDEDGNVFDRVSRTFT